MMVNYIGVAQTVGHVNTSSNHQFDKGGAGAIQHFFSFERITSEIFLGFV